MTSDSGSEVFFIVCPPSHVAFSGRLTPQHPQWATAVLEKVPEDGGAAGALALPLS